MKNLSKLSLKKALTREELKEVKGEGSGCYCQDNWSGPGFILPGSCGSNNYPPNYKCYDVW